jgi:hypothetical protein
MKRCPLPALVALVALAPISLLVSCWAPFYDPRVSNSVPFYGKLGPPFLAIGPLSNDTGMNDPLARLEFLPTRPSANPLDPVDGFLVQTSSDTVTVGFVEYYQGAYRLAPSAQGRPNLLGDGAYARSGRADATGRPQMSLVCDNGYAYQFVFDPVGHYVNQIANMPLTSSVALLGVGATLLMPPATDSDSLSALVYDGSSVHVLRTIVSLTLNAFSDQVLPFLDTGGRSLGAGGRAFQDIPGQHFYYSAPGGPTLLWGTATWPAASTPPTRLPINKLVTALLSDGTLVAQDDNYLSAFSPAGAQRFSIPAGSVHLEHEVYYPGPNPPMGNYVLFSQVLSIWTKGNSELFIYVWRYPVASFAALGN